MDENPANNSPDASLSDTVCFLCRQRKQKCDRVLPTCGYCAKAKVDCEYVPQVEKRGLRAGYVAKLEKKIEVLTEDVRSIKQTQQSTGASLSVLPSVPDGEATPIRESSAAVPGTFHGLQRSSWSDIEVNTASEDAITFHQSLHRPKRRKKNAEQSDSGLATDDLATLPIGFFSNLASLWFKETQPWCPILNEQHIQEALQALEEPVRFIDDIELRAVISLQLSHSTHAIVLGYHGRRRLAGCLREQVVTEAMSIASLSSLRALLITAFLDYGSDNIPSVFNILSMCRRIAESLGLFGKLLHQLEHQSPSQVGPPSRAAFDKDEDNRIAVVWSILALDAVSTLGVPWRDVSAALVDHLLSVAYVSSPDHRDSLKAHVHLCAIGLQPVHTFIHEVAKGQIDIYDESTLQRCEEMYNNTMSYVIAQPTTTYTILADGAVDFDACLVHTSTLTYTAIIMVYQLLIDTTTMTPVMAINRCQEACDGLVMTIRNISDTDAELNTPLLGHFFFVAARFKLIMYQVSGSGKELSFDALMHGLNMCGRRWPVARRLDIVLRAAIFEVDSGQSAGLPKDFWQLKKSHIDISEDLKDWVAQRKPSLYIGALNGPYIARIASFFRTCEGLGQAEHYSHLAIPEMTGQSNRKDRRAEYRNSLRAKKDPVAAKESNSRRKARLARQRSGEDRNRRKALLAFDVKQPPATTYYQILLDFTLNKKDVGYGWMVVAILLLVLGGIWQACTSRRAV